MKIMLADTIVAESCNKTLKVSANIEIDIYFIITIVLYSSFVVIFKLLNRDETLILDEKIYNIRSKGAKTEEKTYIWNDPMKMCSEGGNLKDIIITKAVVYEPQNINLPRMLLYRSDDKQVKLKLI